jgi:transposase
LLRLVLPARQPYLYQKSSQKATQLRLLGMSYKEIAKSLNIGKNTVIRACKYKNNQQ